MNNNIGAGDFLHRFRKQLYELVEISLTADRQQMGTLIHGNSKNFVHDTIDYGNYWAGFASWQGMILAVLQGTNPSSYLFKIDWKNNTANKVTFYFRYMNGIDETKIFYILRSGEYEEPKELLIPASIKYGIGQPVSIGIRIPENNSIPVSLYYDVNRKKASEVDNIASDVAEIMQWPAEAILRMKNKLKCMNAIGQPQYIAFSVAEKVIKINYPRVPVKDFYHSMDFFNTDSARKNEIKSICRQWKQPTLNYLGLKFNHEECGWKAYMVISHKHPGNHLYYNLNV